MSSGQQIVKKTIPQDMGQLITHSSLPSSHPLFVDITVDLLRRGCTVRFRANGRSMEPVINEGEIITVEPVMPHEVKRGEIVLYQNHRGVIAHRVVAIKDRSDELRGLRSEQKKKSPTRSSALSPQHSSLVIFFILRGDSATLCDEPVEPQQILGRVVTVERHGRPIHLNSLKARVYHTARRHVSLLKRLIVQVSA
jgi:hypothetical protein